MTDGAVTLTLTKREAAALLASAKVGLASGKMLTVLSAPEDDLALVEAIVKLSKATTEGVSR